MGLQGICKKVPYVTATDLVERLHTAYRNGSFQEKMRFSQGVDLLLIDELGYLPLDGEGAKSSLSYPEYQGEELSVAGETGEWF